GATSPGTSSGRRLSRSSSSRWMLVMPSTRRESARPGLTSTAPARGAASFEITSHGVSSLSVDNDIPLNVQLRAIHPLHLRGHHPGHGCELSVDCGGDGRLDLRVQDG